MTEDSGVSDSSCRLCRRSRPLRLSHIAPKFVFDHVKAHGRIRQMGLPNRVLQDGPKLQLLCTDCEERLSRWEAKVSSKIFKPIHKQGEERFRYGDWLLPFAVSLSFRIVTYWSEVAESELPTKEQHSVEDAIGRWRTFLLGHSSPEAPDHHMFILPSGEVSPFDSRAKVLSYLSGFVDLQGPYWARDGGLYVIGKMCRLCCIGVIRAGTGSPWRYTKVHRRGGTLGSPYAIAPWVAEYFAGAINAATADLDNLSPRQRARVLEAGLRELLAVAH